MRKFIIDTDTASDDAAALIMAAFEKSIEILGVTTVAGNVDVYQATKNALATLEMCDCSVPVYMGASGPLFRKRRETISVHGKDGMGDCGIVNPVRKEEKERAVDFILDVVGRYPDEIELVVLGPATNIALAILENREIMKRVKHIWSMGTAGFGPGNATPVAEFNVYNDAEAYEIMLNCGVPITIAGFDLCSAGTCLDKTDLDTIANGNKVGRFLERATSGLLDFNLNTRGVPLVDLPDAVAMAAAIRDGFVKESVNCFCKCCTLEESAYGQVILYADGKTYEAVSSVPKPNANVITKVDESLFVRSLLNILK